MDFLGRELADLITSQFVVPIEFVIGDEFPEAVLFQVFYFWIVHVIPVHIEFGGKYRVAIDLEAVKELLEYGFDGHLHGIEHVVHERMAHYEIVFTDVLERNGKSLVTKINSVGPSETSGVLSLF